MKYLLVIFLGFILMGTLSAADKHTVPVQLGDQTVSIIVEDRGQGPTLVHLHQNERTALRAARALHPTLGGRLITLKHRGARNIGFMLNHRHYEFDPNRIFSPQGIHLTLTKFSRDDKAATEAVSHLAKMILKQIPEHGAVLALHNNSNYSMRDYFPGQSLQKDASDIHQQPDQFIRNFFFVTDLKIYQQLSKHGFNVVLQNNHQVQDDGSLSVALAKRLYINIEAGYNQLAQQVDMIKAASASV